MRLFLAIFPPKEYLDYLRDSIRSLNKEKRNLQIVPIDQLHVTIKYIGSGVSEDSAQLLMDEFKLHEGNFGKAILKLNKIQLGFKYQKDPRILLADIEDNNALKTLADNTHSLIKKLALDDTINWKLHKRNAFHITLARLKPTASRKQGIFVRNALKEVKLPTLEPVEIGEMYFVESILQRDRTSVYRKLEKIKL